MPTDKIVAKATSQNEITTIENEIDLLKRIIEANNIEPLLDMTDLSNVQFLMPLFTVIIKDKLYYLWDDNTTRWLTFTQLPYQLMEPLYLHYNTQLVSLQKLLPNYDKESDEFKPLQNKIKAIQSWLKYIKSNSGISKVLNLFSRNINNATDSQVEFNNKWNLLLFKNGVFDVETSTFRKPTPEDMITIECPLVYDPDAKCPTIKKFFKKIFDNKLDKIEFVLQLFASCLTARIDKRSISYWLGAQGGNGKTTITDLFQTMLAPEYSWKCFNEEFYVDSRKNDYNSGSMKNVRMALIVDPTKDRHLDLDKLKEYTGGSKMAARGAYDRASNINTTWNLIYQDNHMPYILANDKAFCDRLSVVRFDYHCPIEERNDAEIKQLYNELPGFFNWIVQIGLHVYKANNWKIQIYESVKQDTEDYIKQFDVIGNFMEETVLVDNKPTSFIQVGTLHQIYKEYMETNGQHPLSLPKFILALSEKGFKHDIVNKAITKKSGGRFYYGMRLKTNHDQLADILEHKSAKSSLLTDVTELH